MIYETIRESLKGRVLACISIALLGSGACLVITGHMKVSANRWSPVQGPVPGPNLTVAFPFTLEYPGDYAFEVCKPTTQSPETVPLPPLPPLMCHLVVTISNSSGWYKTKDITSMHHTSRYVFGHVDYYEGETFRIPERGNYVINVAMIGDVPFVSSGAMFDLGRKENAANVMVFSELTMIAGRWALVGGSIGLLICAFKALRSRTRA